MTGYTAVASVILGNNANKLTISMPLVEATYVSIYFVICDI